MTAPTENLDDLIRLPSAQADFGYWSKMPVWTQREAVALLLGKDPDVITFTRVKPHFQVSSFADEYRRMKNLLGRRFLDRVTAPPAEFIAWARLTGIPIPVELEAALSARGKFAELHEPAECFSSYAESKDRGSQLTKELAAANAAQGEDPSKGSEISTRERDSLLKLVIGMAVEGYRYDPAQKRSSAVPDIVADLERAGVPLDADTVRKWLRQATELLPPQEAE